MGRGNRRTGKGLRPRLGDHRHCSDRSSSSNQLTDTTTGAQASRRVVGTPCQYYGSTSGPSSRNERTETVAYSTWPAMALGLWGGSRERPHQQS
eukprot:2316303-Pyramimonas_sp.AAC.1